MSRRFSRGPDHFNNNLISSIASKIYPDVGITARDARYVEINKLKVGTLQLESRSGVAYPVDSLVAQYVLERIIELELTPTTPGLYDDLLTKADLNDALNAILPKITAFGLAALAGAPPEAGGSGGKLAQLVKAVAERESVVAGVLNYLYEGTEAPMLSVLNKLFFPNAAVVQLDDYESWAKFVDPLETFDPKLDIGNVALSPIGIIHLFSQHFFELDSFLGPSVQHVWLSPGGTVELVEVHSRRVLTERFTELGVEQTTRSERALTQEDEISESIKKDNQDNTKLGVSASVDGGVNFEVFAVHAQASGSYGFDTTEKTAREQLHKRARTQSTKTSNEIKRSFRSTFRTVTEVQDTSSKRYVLKNDTSELVNYELRRKMRRVCVQHQDMGTQLCWQTYVDDAARDLGVAELVHIAEPPDLSAPPPEAPTLLEPQVTEEQIQFAYENTSGSDEKDVTFYKGSDKESWPDHNDKIVWQRSYKSNPPAHGYTLDESIDVTPIHTGTCSAEAHLKDPSGTYEIRLLQVNFEDQSAINLKVKLRWSPPDQKQAEETFKAAQASYAADKSRAQKETFLKAARERIKAASDVVARDPVELREEERIVVYRALISNLLNVGVDLDDAKTRHVASELLNSIFDIEKMLYFVAPEWWRPRLHQSHPSLGAEDGQSDTVTKITPENIVRWGGEGREDNYYITEESRPARLGSSLGWLLQLDGDTMRNAFLNAPWVKAVIPIRSDKGLAALNWLMHASVEGTSGIEASYVPTSTMEATDILATLTGYAWTESDDILRYSSITVEDLILKDVLKYLAVKVKAEHQASTEVETTVIDDVEFNYLPQDMVYDYGFYPLEGGFKSTSSEPFKVFDQWVEVLPTDQLVAVKVEYDPVTGLMIIPESAGTEI